MNSSLLGAWLIELSNYFIKNHKYQMVTMSRNNDEMWIVNPENTSTPIIMISVNPTQQFNPEVIGKHRESLAMVFRVQPVGLNISVNPESELLDDAHVLVNPGKVSESFLISQFSGIENVLKEGGNADRKLSKALTDLRRTVRSDQRNIQIKLSPATTILATISVAVYVLSWFLTAQGFTLDSIAIMLGAFYKFFISNGWEVWRFITSAFVHVNIFHLMMSIMLLRNLGVLLEPIIGSKRYLLTFFLGTLVGNAFLFIMEDVIIGVGMGSGMFALLGVLCVYLYETQMIRNPRIFWQAMTTGITGLMFLFLPGVSTYSILGGFFMGLMLGVLFSKRHDWLSLRKGLQVLVPLFLIALCAVMYMQRVPQAQPTLDQQVSENWNALGLESYAKRITTWR